MLSYLYSYQYLLSIYKFISKLKRTYHPNSIIWLQPIQEQICSIRFLVCIPPIVWWKTLNIMTQSGFLPVICSPGRWYHNVVAAHVSITFCNHCCVRNPLLVLVWPILPHRRRFFWAQRLVTTYNLTEIFAKLWPNLFSFNISTWQRVISCMFIT